LSNCIEKKRKESYEYENLSSEIIFILIIISVISIIIFIIIFISYIIRSYYSKNILEQNDIYNEENPAEEDKCYNDQV
jgi:hypothetical protein